MVDRKLFGLSFLLLLLLGVSPLIAQERSGFQDESYKTQDEMSSESNQNYSPGNTVKEREVSRDSLALKPSSGVNPKADSANPKKNEEEEDEETLSFNVLYFIIQKFKVSDIIN